MQTKVVGLSNIDITNPRTANRKLTGDILEMNPRYRISRDIIARIDILPSRMNYKEAERIIYDSQELDDYYNKFLSLIEDQNREDKLEKFKNEILRGVQCGIKVSSLNTPTKGRKRCQMCHGHGCVHCAKYNAYTRMNHIHDIKLITVYDNRETAKRVCQEINKMGHDHIAAVFTPLHSGYYIVYVANYIPSRTDEIDAIAKQYNFERVNKLSHDTNTMMKYEIWYHIPATGFMFTIEDIYNAKNDGRKGEVRQGGDTTVKMYDSKTGAVVTMTKKEAKAKKKEEEIEAGILATHNPPSLDLDKIPDEELSEIAKEVYQKNSEDKDKFVVRESVAGSPGKTAGLSSTIATEIRDRLIERDYAQPSGYNKEEILKEDYNTFEQAHIVKDYIFSDYIDFQKTEANYTLALNKGWNALNSVQMAIFVRDRGIMEQKHRLDNAPLIDDVLAKVFKDWGKKYIPPA